MKKCLFILSLIIACILYIEIPLIIQAAPIEYHPDADDFGAGIMPFDSLESSNVENGLLRAAPKVAITNSGDIIIIPLYWTIATGGTLALKSSDWGTSWSFDRIILGASHVSPNAAIYQYGDSAFVIDARPLYNVAPRITKYVGITQGIPATVGSLYDTLPLAPGTEAKERFNLKLHGTKLYAWFGRETGTDSMYGYISAGQLADTSTWTKIDSSGKVYASFRRTFNWDGNVKGGFGDFDVAVKDLLWKDTAAIPLDTLSTDLVGWTGADYLSSWITPARDSFVVVASQDTGAGGSLCLKLIRMNIAAGTTTKIGDSVIVLADTYMPALAKVNPTISMVLHTDGTVTDTGYIFFKYWPDETDVDSVGLGYKRFILSTSATPTLGDLSIMKTAQVYAATYAPWNLNAPLKTYNIGGYHYLALAYTDSVGGDLQKLYVSLDKVDVGGEPPAGCDVSNTLSIKDVSVVVQNIYTYETEESIDSIQLVWDDDNSILSPIGSVKDVTDLVSPDTLTATGLTEDVEYWFWWITHFETCSDTSTFISVAQSIRRRITLGGQ